MNTITYKQASELLGKATITIKQAVQNYVLTRIGGKPQLLKEQVELFKGKQLTLHSLDIEELKQWQDYEKIALEAPRVEPHRRPVTLDLSTREIMEEAEKATLALKTLRIQAEKLLASLPELRQPSSPLV